MNRQYTVEVLEDLAAIRRLFADWQGIEHEVPMRQPWWSLAWWDAFQPDATPFVLVARGATGELRGVFPLYRQPIVKGRYALRCMADGNAYTDYVSVSAKQADGVGVAESFADFLATHAEGQALAWDHMVLDGVAESDQPMQAFVTKLESRGAQTLAVTRSHLWRLPTDQTVDEWLGGMSRSSRRLIRKRIARIEKLESLQFLCAESEAEVEPLTRDVIRFHQRRWNDDGEPGSFADPRMTPFIIEVNQAAYASGALHLGVWKIAGEPLAGEMGYINDAGVLFLYCVGRNPNAPIAELGLLQTLAGQLNAFRGTVTAIDYLRGDEPYKKRSHAVPTPCVQLRISAPVWSSRFRHAIWTKRFEVAQFLRRKTGRTPYRYASLAGEPSPLSTTRHDPIITAR